MDEELRQLKERISKLSDDELLDMVELDSTDYRKEALDYARAELMARGIEFQEGPIEAPQVNPIEQAAEQPATAGRVVTCPGCGGKTRPGILFADRELTMVFADNNEERFVEVHACSQCGQVQMVVDFDTDVQQ